MSKFVKISPFLGMVPRLANRLLPDGMGTDASNMDLSSGEIRALKQSQLVHLPSGSGPWLSTYRAQWKGVEKWIDWNKDVDVAKLALSADVEARYYWSGDNEPRYATFTNLLGTFLTLGIPKPVTAPTVAPSGGVGSTVARVYVYTFFSALGEESAPSASSALASGKVDSTWAISGMDAFPISSGACTGVYSSGYTTFTNTGGKTWLRVGDEVLLGASKAVVTETAASNTFKVAGNYAATTSWSRVAPWNTTGMKRRLYRSAGTNATYELVSDDVGTAYNDTLTDSQILGDELISATWDVPPAGLKGMFELPCGSLGGFIDNQLCLSEPYQGHAWPTNYRWGTDSEIIGAMPYGNTVVIGTATLPYVLTGNDPASMTMDSVKEVWPCLSKRSMVSVGDGVLFSTSYGMAYIGLTGPEIRTLGLFTQTEWVPLDPTSMISAASEGKVFVRWSGTDGSKGVMVFIPSESQAGMRKLSICPDELYSDPRNGKLYLVDSTGVNQYNAGTGSKLSYSWRSKEFFLPMPLNFGVAKVDFESEMSEADYAAAQAAFNAQVAANISKVTGYAGIGGINRSQVDGQLLNGSNVVNVALPNLSSINFSLWGDGKLVHSRTLAAGSGIFRLPPGAKYSSVEVGLTGTCRIKAVRVAETPADLAQIP